MKKKEILTIFLLAAIVTASTLLLNSGKCFLGISSVCYVTHCRGWPLGFYAFYTADPSLLKFCTGTPPHSEFIWIFLLFFLVDFLFWFLVLTVGWWMVKKLTNKKER